MRVSYYYITDREAPDFKGFYLLYIFFLPTHIILTSRHCDLCICHITAAAIIDTTI